MHWSIAEFGKNGCTRAIYIVVNKDNDDIYTERLEYDAKAAQEIVDKALAIITAAEPPVGISTDPTWYECKFCDYQLNLPWREATGANLPILRPCDA
jgi:hypothetical protein